jgi:hypothetical protein
LAAHSGNKHDYQHIPGKNMIGTTFWVKTCLAAHSSKTRDWLDILRRKYDWQRNLGKNMIGSTFCQKT